MSEKETQKERIEERRKAVLERIVKRRRALGISQADLTMLLGIGFSGYYKVETGKTKLDTYRLFEILGILKISPEDFFKGMK